MKLVGFSLTMDNVLSTVLVKLKIHISFFMEKLSECKNWNFMAKKKITWKKAEKNEM